MAFKLPTSPRAKQFAEPPNQEHRPSEKIPPLTQISPCIFVPLRDDMVKRLAEPSRDRVERLRRILESLDCQREGVKQNLMYMFNREKQRLILEAAEREAAEGVRYQREVDQSEIDQVIQNMEAPIRPGQDYNIRQEDIPQRQIHALLPPMPVRDKVIEDLLNMIEQGTGQLTGYERYIANIKQHYLDTLEKELERVKEAGLRPQERTSLV